MSYIRLRRLIGLRGNVFFGRVPKPGDKRQGPPRDQCHGDAAIAHARRGFVRADRLSASVCASENSWGTSLLAHQVRQSGLSSWAGDEFRGPSHIRESLEEWCTPPPKPRGRAYIGHW